MALRAPRIDRPSFDAGRQIGRVPFKTLYDLLIKKHQKNGDLDPAGRARLDIERILAAAFEDLAKHYSGRKKAALERLLKLQKEALDFYDSVLSGGGVDVARLERILKDMDRTFRELARKADDIATDLPPVKRTEHYDPKSKTTTIHYGGGADAGGATYVVDTAGHTIEATVAIEGPHPGREKGSLPDPKGGLVPGEHRGHMGPEGGVADPRVVNVVHNLISEAPHSNLSPKKKFDNLASKVAAALPGRRVRTRSKPVRKPGVARPDEMVHEIIVDGKVLYTVTIPNE